MYRVDEPARLGSGTMTLLLKDATIDDLKSPPTSTFIRLLAALPGRWMKLLATWTSVTSSASSGLRSPRCARRLRCNEMRDESLPISTPIGCSPLLWRDFFSASEKMLFEIVQFCTKLLDVIAPLLLRVVDAQVEKISSTDQLRETWSTTTRSTVFASLFTVVS